VDDFNWWNKAFDSAAKNIKVTENATVSALIESSSVITSEFDIKFPGWSKYRS